MSLQRMIVVAVIPMNSKVKPERVRERCIAEMKTLSSQANIYVRYDQVDDIKTLPDEVKGEGV